MNTLLPEDAMNDTDIKSELEQALVQLPAEEFHDPAYDVDADGKIVEGEKYIEVVDKDK